MQMHGKPAHPQRVPRAGKRGASECPRARVKDGRSSNVRFLQILVVFHLVHRPRVAVWSCSESGVKVAKKRRVVAKGGGKTYGPFHCRTMLASWTKPPSPSAAQSRMYAKPHPSVGKTLQSSSKPWPFSTFFTVLSYLFLGLTGGRVGAFRAREGIGGGRSRQGGRGRKRDVT